MACRDSTQPISMKISGHHRLQAFWLGLERQGTKGPQGDGGAFEKDWENWDGENLGERGWGEGWGKHLNGWGVD